MDHLPLLVSGSIIGHVGLSSRESARLFQDSRVDRPSATEASTAQSIAPDPPAVQRPTGLHLACDHFHSLVLPLVTSHLQTILQFSSLSFFVYFYSTLLTSHRIGVVKLPGNFKLKTVISSQGACRWHAVLPYPFIVLDTSDSSFLK